MGSSNDFDLERCRYYFDHVNDEILRNVGVDLLLYGVRSEEDNIFRRCLTFWNGAQQQFTRNGMSTYVEDYM